jgi:hypothetical protein
MNVTAAHNTALTPQMQGETLLRRDTATYISTQTAALEQAIGSAGHPDVLEKIDTAARQLVAQTFFTEMLAHQRDGTFAAGPFGPTMAEQRFGPMFDQHVAERMAQRSDLALTTHVKHRVLQWYAQAQGIDVPEAAASREVEHPDLESSTSFMNERSVLDVRA